MSSLTRRSFTGALAGASAALWLTPDRYFPAAPAINFYFDDIFPNSLGRPIFPHGLGRAPGI